MTIYSLIEFKFEHLNTGMTSITFFSDRTHVIDFLNYAEHMDEWLEATMESGESEYA